MIVFAREHKTTYNHTRLHGRTQGIVASSARDWSLGRSVGIESVRRAGIESTSGPRALTPVHRARSRALSDSRYAALRVDLRLRRVDGRGGSTGRTRLCRRSKALRTRHRPHVRTRNPNGRAHRSMWRPCSPDGELGIGRHRPLRTPAENFGKTTSPLELTL